MLGQALVIVADAHLGGTPASVEECLLAFLEAVPELGDCLLVNGDLFEFWFSYSRVIPRRGFHVAAALARLGRRLPVVLVGGNHDRWGGDFWERDLGLRFAPDRVAFQVGARRVLAIHGDGLTEPTRRAVTIHRLIMHPLTAAVYRTLHPELGLRLVERLAPSLGDHSSDPAHHRLAAERQQRWAEEFLRANLDVDLLLMAHTHQPCLVEVGPGRYYLNPGAWFAGFRYAVATEQGAELGSFMPSGPPPPSTSVRR